MSAIINRMMLSVATSVATFDNNATRTPTLRVTYHVSGGEYSSLNDAVHASVNRGDCCPLTMVRVDGREIGTLRDLFILR